MYFRLMSVYGISCTYHHDSLIRFKCAHTGLQSAALSVCHLLVLLDTPTHADLPPKPLTPTGHAMFRGELEPTPLSLNLRCGVASVIAVLFLRMRV